MNATNLKLKWIRARQNEEFAAVIANRFDLHPLVARVLSSRFTTMDSVSYSFQITIDKLQRKFRNRRIPNGTYGGVEGWLFN